MEKRKSVSAGASTTPAGNTQEYALNVVVDWVTCSFFTPSDFELVFNLIGIGDLENLEIKPGSRYEFAKYDMTYKLGAIEILHSTELGKYMLNMSGQACREFELISTFDFVTLFGILTHVDASYTRLDIAIDDFTNIYSTNVIRKAVYNKQCVTRLTDWGNGERGKIAHGNDFLTMDNFYLGSPSSRYFINVYDKKMERESKDFEVNYDTWTRTEVRFSDEYAEMFVMNILNDSDSVGDKIFAFLNDKISFLKPVAMKLDKNKSRLAKKVSNHTEWWRKFLNTTKKLPLTVYKPEMPLIHAKGWLLHQVSVTLASFEVYLDNDQAYDNFIKELVVTGRDKMQKHHIARIRKQQKLDDYIANDADALEWYKREVAPVVDKNERIVRTAKEKNEHKSKVFDVYWEQVSAQQKNLSASDQETL